MTQIDFIEAMRQELEGVSILHKLSNIDYSLRRLIMSSPEYIGVKAMLDMFMKDKNASFPKTYSQVCEFLGVKLSATFFERYLSSLGEPLKAAWDKLGISVDQFKDKCEEMVNFFIEEKRYDTDA